MKVAHIVPVEYKNPSPEYVMLLAHLMDNPVYVKNNLQARNGKYIILDNSIIELGNAMTIERLCDLAEKHLVNEIILPDVFKDKKATIKSTLEALNYIDKRYGGNKPFKVMAVPQGNCEAEWLSCFQSLVVDSRIDVIGIPKVLDIITQNGRAFTVLEIEKYLSKNKENDNPCTKEFHLLGCHNGLVDIPYYNSIHPWIRGIDTCMAYIIARDYKDKPLGDTFNIVRPKKTIDFNDSFDTEILQLLNHLVMECDV